MSGDSNDQNDVLRAQVASTDPMARLSQENATLRAKLAALEDNVVQGRFTGEAPAYLLNEAGFYDDTYFVAGSRIEFLDTPNLTMVPLNEPARRAMQEHIEILEAGARRKAEGAGRQYFGLVTDRNNLIDQTRLDAQMAAAAPIQVINMPEPIGAVPAMPHTDDAIAAAKRGRGRPKKVLSSSAPPVGGRDVGTPILNPAPAPSRDGPAVLGRKAG